MYIYIYTYVCIDLSLVRYIYIYMHIYVFYSIVYVDTVICSQLVISGISSHRFGFHINQLLGRAMPGTYIVHSKDKPEPNRGRTLLWMIEFHRNSVSLVKSCDSQLLWPALAEVELLKGFLRGVSSTYQQIPFHNFAHVLASEAEISFCDGCCRCCCYFCCCCWCCELTKQNMSMFGEHRALSEAVDVLQALCWQSRPPRNPGNPMESGVPFGQW